jgi:ApaG protein
VTVVPVFLEEHSRPDEGHYIWAYHITIMNDGERRVQLMNRHWKITEGIRPHSLLQSGGIALPSPKSGVVRGIKRRHRGQPSWQPN